MTISVPVCEKDQAHASVMQLLSLRLDSLLDVLPRNSSLIYLDVPLHFNVGDLLINAGTEAFFRRSGLNPVRRATFFDACTVDWASPAAARLKPSFVESIDRIDLSIPIVLHGGGSLGDIYPELQAMREAIVMAFPDRRIIVFPQSLHFDDPDRQARSLRTMLAHRDIHVFVRDQSSLDAIRAVSQTHGSLMPDMAHALWDPYDRFRRVRPSAETLVMCRRDAETQSAAQENSFDWPDIIRPTDTMIWRALRKAMYVDFGGEPQRMRAWYWLRDRIIRRAVAKFSDCHTIGTDRLHGLLLASLLNRRVTFRDNRYGKLSRYVDEWLGSSPMLLNATREGTPK